jgi:hypothetical protein
MTSAFIPGKMAECMKDSTKRTKSTGLAFIHGLTIKSDFLIQAGGTRASSTASVFLSLKQEAKRSLEYGKKARK